VLNSIIIYSSKLKEKRKKKAIDDHKRIKVFFSRSNKAHSEDLSCQNPISTFLTIIITTNKILLSI